MEQKLFCQSCTMPIDNMEDRGTEKNGAASDLYCKYCYRDGAFTDPMMTLGQMKNMAVAAMQEQKLSNDIIQRSLNMLPDLKRWKENVANSQL